MTTTACPNCSEPLRPGARFCGNCGIEVPAAQPPAAVPAQAGADNCPHCGKPVRPGAKFCNSCGKTIEPASTQEAPIAALSASPPQAATLPAQAPAEIKPAAPAGPPPAKAPAVSKPARKRGWIGFVLALLVAICALSVFTTYIYVRDPMGWFGSPSPTALQVAAPTQTATSTVFPSATPEQPPSPTLPPAPTNTSPPPATSTIAALDTPTVSLSPTVPLASPSPQVAILFEDDFDADLNTNWKVWGDPRPKINTGPGDNWLDLAASDQLGSAGVTSKAVILNTPGVEFILKGQLNKNYAQYALAFDWDPVQYVRGPENRNPGVIHFEIRRSKLILKAPITKENCEREQAGAETHTYRLKITEGQGVELYLDDQALPICQVINMGLAPTDGTISFTGVGWVTSVVVAVPR